jgi:hypothetical protein
VLVAFRRLAFVCLLALVARPAAAEPLAPEDVPEPLAPWVEWVLRGHESARCPRMDGSAEPQCVFHTRLALSLGASGGTFALDGALAVRAALVLPGGDGEPAAWPEDVEVDGAPQAVVAVGGRPTLTLEPGRHRVTGRFVWSALPPVLAIPGETALLQVTVDGRPLAAPRRDAEGRLWLREAAGAGEAGAGERRVEVEVHRLVRDGVPLALETRIRLRVSGDAREELLGKALPPGFAPLSVEGELPARLEPDGRLRVQLRAGVFDLTLGARGEADLRELSLGPRDPRQGAWDDAEEWSFEAAPALRLVELSGPPSVDPTQTQIPREWHGLPAVRMTGADVLRLDQKRRGTEGAAADRLSLVRSWHLDFDGGGATVVDHISGELRAATRLEMGAATALGRAAVGGVDQPITRRGAEGLAGVELPLGALSLEADSRVEGTGSRLPAAGWEHDFESVSAQLQLPPGYRLLHARGVDRARPSWVAEWNAYRFFVVFLIALAAWRLFGVRAGVLALATLALTYTEGGAPRYLWAAALAGEALVRALPPGRIARAALALVLVALPFALQQVRAGLFPVLERPWLGVGGVEVFAGEEAAMDAAQQEGIVAERALEVPASAPIAREEKQQRLESLRRARVGRYEAAREYAPDPNASVPTGPGRPEWTWQQVELVWSGPVARGEEMSLWLIPPWLNAVLALVRVALVAALALVVLPWTRPRLPAFLAPAPVAAALLVVLFAGPARADFPSPELLDQLRERLLAPPDCSPSCATLARLGLRVLPERLDLVLDVDAAADVAFPLPGGGAEAGFVPESASVDGAPAAALRRDGAGQLWLRLAPGRHSVALSGALPARASVELALPLAPRRVELLAEPAGWSVLGLRADGGAEGALSLVRAAAAGATREEARLEPSAIPPFVAITRELSLGLAWHVTTTVRRVAPREGAIVVSVPLLPGEAVTSAGVETRNGVVVASLDASAGETSWASQLAESAALALAAPRGAAWTETWIVDASPLWHVEASGVPAVDEVQAGRRAREYRPWPGEMLALALERPAGTEGETRTLDRAQLELAPGRRATDATLTLALRSSQGGQHTVVLPEGAELIEVAVDDRVQPRRQDGRDVTFAIHPGAQTVRVVWRAPEGVAVVTRAPEVGLGLPVVNANLSLQVPEDRWTLAAGGPRLGPVVLFWPVLLLVVGLAWGLGRIPWTPLRMRHWLLLGLGLTQAPFLAAVGVVAWLLLLGLRGRLGERAPTLAPAWFDAIQLLLALATLVALACLFLAVQAGLVGSPAMQIAGNDSTAELLRWYQDRSGETLPRPWLFSLAIGWYRVLMLAWSFWMAAALVGWLRWGWSCFASGLLWARVRGRNRPAQAAAPEA